MKATFVLHCFNFQARIMDSKFQIVLQEIVVILAVKIREREFTRLQYLYPILN